MRYLITLIFLIFLHTSHAEEVKLKSIYKQLQVAATSELGRKSENYEELEKNFLKEYLKTDGPIRLHDANKYSVYTRFPELYILRVHFVESIREKNISKEDLLKQLDKITAESLTTYLVKTFIISEWNESNESKILVKDYLKTDLVDAFKAERIQFINTARTDENFKKVSPLISFSPIYFDRLIACLESHDYKKALAVHQEISELINSKSIKYTYYQISWPQVNIILEPYL